jgi:hypothetical protein
LRARQRRPGGPRHQFQRADEQAIGLGEIGAVGGEPVPRGKRAGEHFHAQPLAGWASSCARAPSTARSRRGQRIGVSAGPYPGRRSVGSSEASRGLRRCEVRSASAAMTATTASAAAASQCRAGQACARRGPRARSRRPGAEPEPEPREVVADLVEQVGELRGLVGADCPAVSAGGPTSL